MGSRAFEDHDLVQLEVDLSEAPLRVRVGARRVVEEGARIIDRQMTKDATGHIGNYFGILGTEFPTPLELHVSHEMLSWIEAEIGIEYKGAGKLAHIIVHGSVNNAPVYNYWAGPARHIPAIAGKFADMAERSVLGERE